MRLSRSIVLQLATLVLCNAACSSSSTSSAPGGKTDAGNDVGDAGVAPQTLASRLPGPWGVALDGTHVYWTNEGTEPAWSNGSVMRMPLEGGTSETLVTASDRPHAIAVHGDYVYIGSIAGTGRLSRVKKTGGTEEPLNSGSGPVRALAIDDPNVYFVTDNNAYRLPLADGTPAELGTTSGGCGIAVDGTRVYWTAKNGHAVYSAPKDGSSPATQIFYDGASTDAKRPCAIAVRGELLFWLNAAPNGEVVRTRIDGSDLIVLAGLPALRMDEARGLALDDTEVYFSASWVTVAGGRAERCAPFRRPAAR